MSYSDFTLKRVKDEFGLNVIEDQDLFSKIPEISISEYLSITLSYNVPLAMAVGTEKAISLARWVLCIRDPQANNEYTSGG